MPTYDYRCSICGHQFEHFQSMFDEPLKSCPKCNSEVRRVISGGSGLIFKGSGFYITDYKGKNAQNTQTPKSTTSEDKKSSEKKPAVKPAKKENDD